MNYYINGILSLSVKQKTRNYWEIIYIDLLRLFIKKWINIVFTEIF